MPLADGQHIPSDVLLGIARQTADVSLVPASTPPLASRRSGEAMSRNLLMMCLVDMKVKVAVMMDRDVVLTNKTVVERLVEVVMMYKDLVMVHVPHKPGGDPFHMDLGCVAFRKELCTRLTWPTMETEGCLCGFTTTQLQSIGGRQLWLPTDGQELDAEEITIQ